MNNTNYRSRWSYCLLSYLFEHLLLKSIDCYIANAPIPFAPRDHQRISYSAKSIDLSYMGFKVLNEIDKIKIKNTVWKRELSVNP